MYIRVSICKYESVRYLQTEYRYFPEVEQSCWKNTVHDFSWNIFPNSGSLDKIERDEPGKLIVCSQVLQHNTTCTKCQEEGKTAHISVGNNRHRSTKNLRENIQGIRKPALCRLARRGGVKRLSQLMSRETRSILKRFLKMSFETPYCTQVAFPGGTHIIAEGWPHP